MSASATKVGARSRGSVLAGACEALIAAVYLDSDLKTTREVFAQLWRDSFQRDGDSLQRRDPKTRLQEWAQGSVKPTPAYEMVSRTGPDHAPQFTISVQVQGLEPASGQGSSRREAEKAAAEAMLTREGAI